MKYDEFKALYAHKASGRKHRHVEEDIQTACVQWFRLAYPEFIIMAIPNGGSRNAREGANLKRSGVLAGASDLLVIANRSVLFVEMKTPKGHQQETQIIFQRNIERLGHDYRICHSLHEFQLTIERWFKEKFGYEV